MKKTPKKFAYVDTIDQLKTTPEASGGFMSVSAAGKFLGITKSQLAQLEARGDLAGYRLRTTTSTEDESKDNIFYSAESLKAYAEKKQATKLDKAEKAAEKAAEKEKTAVGAGVSD